MKAIALIIAIFFGAIGASTRAADTKPAPASAPAPAPAPPTAPRPAFFPGGGEFKEPVKVVIKAGKAGATIRYTLDGTAPSEKNGQDYKEPVVVDHTATLLAVAFQEGLPPSPAVWATYFVGDAKPGLNTFHIGNSLTGTTANFGNYARAAGYKHSYTSFLRGGALTKRLWDNEVTKEKTSWEKTWGGVSKVDVFTLQPRDFNIPEEASYDVKFLDVVRQKAPDMQPWLYIEWDEKPRRRWSDQGAVPSSEMKVLWPAVTWQESMSAMLLYGEELHRKLGEIYKEGKPLKVLPSGIAMGWACDMVEHGQLPGIAKEDYWTTFFGKDNVHPNANGAFLVDCTWYSAFYKESPEGKVPPLMAKWTPEQALILQKLAWDVVQNYPDAGLYVEGKTPSANPHFDPEPAAIADITPVRLTSATPGAWFRYTLDGTTPTHSNGYLYCGVISVRPGMTVKAVAFKNEMADSAVSIANWPAAPRKRELFRTAGKGMSNLDLSITGPLAQYIRHNGTQLPDSALWTPVLSVGAPGQTIWVSGSIKRNDDSNATVELVLDSQTGNRPDLAKSIAAGFFGKESTDPQTGKKFWSLRVGDKVVRTNMLATPGTAMPLLIELRYDPDTEKPSHVSLFTSHLVVAGTPVSPEVSVEVPPHFEWRSVGYHSAPDGAADFGEIVVGESAGAVISKP